MRKAPKRKRFKKNKRKEAPRIHEDTERIEEEPQVFDVLPEYDEILPEGMLDPEARVGIANRARTREVMRSVMRGVMVTNACKDAGMSLDTFNGYRQRWPEINDIIDQGKAILYERVLGSYEKLLIGYEYKKQKVVKSGVLDDKGNATYTRVRAEQENVVVPPNARAVLRFLDTQKPPDVIDHARDVTPGQSRAKQLVDNMSPAARREFVKAAMKAKQPEADE